MNTAYASSCIERKRKNAVALCKAVVKYLEAEDGKEEIDTLLDTALDRLAEVSLKMRDAHLRAVAERETLSQVAIRRENNKKRAKIRRISVAQGEKEKTIMAMLRTKQGREFLHEFLERKASDDV